MGGASTSADFRPTSQEDTLAFLLDLATADKCEAGGQTITRGEFTQKDSPVSFEASANRLWFKDRFRAADGGKHEWIPSNKITDVLTRASTGTGVIAKAKWVLAQHWLRSPTTQLIFEPSQFSDEWQAFVNADDEHMAEMIATVKKASDLGLSGHVGALYITDEGKEPMQVKKYEHEWHRQLREVYDGHSGTPEAFVSTLKTKVVGDGDAASTTPRMVWGGSFKSLTDNMLSQFAGVEADATAFLSGLEADFTSGAKKSENRVKLAETLGALAKRQGKAFDKIQKMFLKTEEALDEY